MADIIISDGRYGGFHISENSIKLEGYECKQEDLNKLQQMTYNDWLYEDGNIYNII